MNIKIYFNTKRIEFFTNGLQPSQNQEFIIYDYLDSKNFQLKEIINQFLNLKNSHSIAITNGDFAVIFTELKTMFHYIEAAGGFIEKENKFLFIHRHGRWDLPKGKLEKKETIENAAIRECEEECGIKELKIIKPLHSTFHIYAHKNSFALKQSYWFYMISSYNKALVPQTEEDIDRVEWFTKTEIEATILSDTYFTISDVVKQALLTV